MVSAELPDNWQELIAGYVLGNLSEEEASTVESLLSSHPELMPEIEAFQESFNVFADMVPLQSPPAQLRDKILMAAQQGPNQAAPIAAFVSNVSNDRAPRRLKLIIGGGGAIAAGILVALGLRIASLNHQLQQANSKIETLERNLQQAQVDRPVLDTLQQPGTSVYALKGSDRANTASGSLVVSGEKNQVIILVQNLPELPAGKTYRLWAKVPSETSLAYCGQFNTNAQGVVQLTPSANICGANPTQLFITIDALTDPTTKGGPVIMQSRI
jgi:hypothetical protein